ncbi:hypothetical protein H6P81_006652 [Aristolochia fimbriata]|uniref:DEUBAD domain-containing protein n=1 Tax=Aristolochia fimbriata TaxID=158543 RepID=A0AAV7EY97_ARIFI|nr:hypothetical protein H6P81_006652 [Aristolochia fimbriata]
MAIVRNNFRVARFDSDYSPGSRDSLSSDDDDLQTRSSSSESGPDTESESDVDSGAASDDFDLSELGEVGAEFCQVGNHNFSVPLNLYDLPDLCEILSLDTWNNCLTEDERFYLAEFLPDMDQETFIRTLKELFSGSNFHFGSPLSELFNRLKGGLCEPRVALYQQGLKFLEKRRHYHLLHKYQNTMVDSLIQIKDAWENYAGYGLEDRLHLLTLMKSQRELQYGKDERLGNDTDLSEKEESSEGFWNKKLKDVRVGSKLSNRASYSLKPSMTLEAGRYGKLNPKGILKVAAPKGPSKTLPSSNSGLFDVKSRVSSSKMGLTQHDQPGRYDFGSARQQRNRFIGDGDAEEEAYETGYRKSRKMDRVKSAKSGRKQEFFNEEANNYMEYPFSVNENLPSRGKNRNSKQMVDMEVFSRKPIDDGLSYGPLSFNGGKKSKYSEKLHRSMGEEWVNSPKKKGSRVDWSAGNGPLRHSKKTEDLFPLDHAGKIDGWTAKNKIWKTGQEFKTLKKSYKDSLQEMSDFYFQADHRAKMSQEKLARKYAENGGVSMGDYRFNSPFPPSEETESDSSEQVNDDAEFDLPIRKLGHSSGVHSSSTKARHDSKKRSKLVKKDKNERAQGLGERLHSPEIEIFTSKGKQKRKINDARHYNETLHEGNYPASAKTGDDHKKPKSGKKNKILGEPGEKLQVSLPKTSSKEKKRKAKGSRGYSSPRAKYEVEEENFNDQTEASRPGKKFPNLENHWIESEQHEKLSVPFSGSNSVTRKRKGKVDTTYMESPDESDHLQWDSQKPVSDFSSTKKKGKKKLEADPSPVPMVSSEVMIEGGGDIEPESKPLKKQFPLITPTVHTGFSFSIIHLLSAVRMAMITSNPEDIIEKTGGRLKESANGSFHEILDINMTTEEQKGEKSLPALTVQEIVNRVKSNPGDPCILETQEPLQDLVRGVLKIFSSKTAPLGAKGWKALVSYEKAIKSWSWVGPVPSSLSEIDPVEEETTSAAAWAIPHKMLVKLVDAFANWLKSGQETLQQIGSLPAPPVMLMPNMDEKERFRDLRAQKSLITINPSSDEVRAYFRREEILRYSVPDRAFSYTAADGRKSIVAPLRRCGGKPTSKARDHFMLKPDRPPHVTILCLVRDAAARLPGSIGTRADVCTLIRDSQFIVEDVSDAQVNQVVSGALDRLHYERDPCVQFDAERKLWVYLHRDREEEDFEDDGTSSTKKWKRQRKDLDQTDMGSGNDAMAYQGTVDPVVGGGPELDYGSEFNADPSSVYEQEKTENAYDHLRPNMEENIEPFVDSATDGMHPSHPMGWEVLELNRLQEQKMLCQENTNEDFDDEGFGQERIMSHIYATSCVELVCSLENELWCFSLLANWTKRP